MTSTTTDNVLYAMWPMFTLKLLLGSETSEILFWYISCTWGTEVAVVFFVELQTKETKGEINLWPTQAI